MCGIFGVAAFREGRFHGSLLRQGVRLLAHRGPDGQGVAGWDRQGHCYRDRDAERDLVLGLGHCRLAIFDLSQAGLQPMQNSRGQWIVYNGEIYNFPELREELKTLGHRFHTDTDTEVILAAYAQWGTECVTRFNGMWALALYDPVAAGLLLSRDRLGIKPLYYVRRGDLFCFASELPAVFHCLGRTPPIDARQLARYVVFGETDDDPQTVYSGVCELRGGHSAWLDLNSGKLSIGRYWSLPDGPDLELGDEEALDRFSALLEDSVRLRLRADVPVAITLSGGTDSSAVTVAASRVSTREIVTFTSKFSRQSEIDETAYAQEVARRCRARSILVEPDLSRLVEEEPLLTKHQAVPYGSLSLYVHWAILNRIREHRIPVVLCGQGGDELFLGYELYYVARILSLWPNVIGMLGHAVRASMRSRLGFSKMAAYLAYFGSPRLRRATLLRRVGKLFRRDLIGLVPSQSNRLATDLRELQAQEILGSTLGRLLRYDDRTTAAHGMETRLPLLDYRLVEFAYRLPWRHKIRAGWTKYLLRCYLQRHLSASIAWRRCKLGFNAPNDQWSTALVQSRGREVLRHPFGELLLRDHVQLERLSARQRWMVYNILHLAALLDWRELAA